MSVSINYQNKNTRRKPIFAKYNKSIGVTVKTNNNTKINNIITYYLSSSGVVKRMFDEYNINEKAYNIIF